MYIQSAAVPFSSSDETVGDGPTPRELQVLRLAAEGRSNAEIAQELRMSQRTVQFHLANLFAKLDAESRTEMVFLARKRGWIE
jgi:DNA-binding NarL/FixJ family response regulator